MFKYLPNFIKRHLLNSKLQHMEACWYEKAIEMANLKTVDKWAAKCLDTTNAEGQTALLFLSKISCEDWTETPAAYLELLQLILSKDVKINTKDKYGFTALVWACINGNFDFVKALVEAGADLNDRNKIGISPLQVVIQMVCFTNDFEIANYIFDSVPVIERSIVQELAGIAKNHQNQRVIDWLANRGIIYLAPANKYSTAIRVATPFSTWSSIIE